MKKLILSSVFALACFAAYSQNVTTSDGATMKKAGDVYQVYLPAKTLKGAAGLIADSIKGRKDSSFTLNGKEYAITYSEKVYSFNGATYVNLEECRKAVKVLIESGI